MDVLREREVKDNLERQLIDEQKLRGKWSARYNDQTLLFYVSRI